MPKPTELQRLAIRAIKLIEDDISERFGLKVVMGAELEFVAKLTREHNSSPTLRKNPLFITTNKYRDSYIPSNQKPSDGKAKYFPESPYISSFKTEQGMGQYEIVFSHLVEHGSPVVLARAIESTRRVLLNAQDGTFVEKVLLDDYIAENGSVTSNALQISVSVAAPQGDNIFYGLGKDEIRFVNNRITEITSETLLMTASKERSYKRFTDKGASYAPKVFKAGHSHTLRSDGSNEEARFETRTPGADSDPYMAVLGAIACAHHILCPSNRSAYNDTFDLRGFPSESDLSIPIPKNIHDSARRFEDGHILRDMLNSLSGEERLGDRLHEAVLEHVRKRGNDIGEGMGRS